MIPGIVSGSPIKEKGLQKGLGGGGRLLRFRRARRRSGLGVRGLMLEGLGGWIGWVAWW